MEKIDNPDMDCNINRNPPVGAIWHDLGVWLVGWTVMLGIFLLVVPGPWVIDPDSNLVNADSTPPWAFAVLWIVLCLVVLAVLRFTKSRILWPLGLLYPAAYMFFGVAAEFNEEAEPKFAGTFSMAPNLSAVVALCILLPVCLGTIWWLQGIIQKPEERRKYLKYLEYCAVLSFFFLLYQFRNFLPDFFYPNEDSGADNPLKVNLVWDPVVMIAFAPYYVWCKRRGASVIPLCIGAVAAISNGLLESDVQYAESFVEWFIVSLDFGGS